MPSTASRRPESVQPLSPHNLQNQPLFTPSPPSRNAEGPSVQSPVESQATPVTSPVREPSMDLDMPGFSSSSLLSHIAHQLLTLQVNRLCRFTHHEDHRQVLFVPRPKSLPLLTLLRACTRLCHLQVVPAHLLSPLQHYSFLTFLRILLEMLRRQNVACVPAKQIKLLPTRVIIDDTNYSCDTIRMQLSSDLEIITIMTNIVLERRRMEMIQNMKRRRLRQRENHVRIKASEGKNDSLVLIVYRIPIRMWRGLGKK
ncbi:hypothetical protein DL96DRAFT_1066091 [Flagelloscypha sp. PMI_526]|nr:hypothetical protein DL96DRAFT_1066091 [Flagelloscypha sp. PMI_526]